MWREIMVIHFPYHPEWSSAPFSKASMSFDRDYYSLPLPSRDKWVCWHAKTNYGHLPLFRRLQCLSIETTTVSLCHLETIKFVGTRRQIMVICLPSPSRENQVQWHVKTNYGHLPPFWRLQCLSIETITISLCYPETIKFVGMQRQIMLICFRCF